MTNNPIVPLGSPSPASEAFKVYTSKPEVRFLSKAVQPPSAVYVDTSDVLQVGAASSAKFEVVTINYRLLRADGELIKGQFLLNPPLNRSIVIHQEPLAEGFLLSVSCKAAVATSRGQTFVRVFLTDPTLGGGQPSYMLMADYVTTAMAPAHPNGRVLAPSEGPGFVYAVSPPAPVAGAEWVFTVPTNARWRPITGYAALNTSGAVSNRQPGLLISSGVTHVFVGWGQVNETATTANIIGYHSTYNTPAFTPFSAWAPLPADMILLGGYFLQSFTGGLDAADQYSDIAFSVEEWLDNV